MNKKILPIVFSFLLFITFLIPICSATTITPPEEGETRVIIFISDDEGNPIPNADVKIYNSTGYFKTPVAEGKSDSNGYFECNLNTGSEYQVEAESADGSLFGKSNFYIEEGYLRNVIYNLILAPSSFFNTLTEAGNNAIFLIAIAGIALFSIIIFVYGRNQGWF